MKNNFESILFEKHWHLACHKNELKNNNDYVRFNTQFGDVTIFNDYGELIAFDNLCAHRGASIFLKNYGNNEFKCPYHNWIYKKGKIFIPKKTSYILKEEPQINRYELSYCGDFIFFSVKPKATLKNQLGDAFEVISEISKIISIRKDFNRFVYQCYWPIAIENALEPIHINSIHPDTLGKLEFDDGEDVFYKKCSLYKTKIKSKTINKKLLKLKKYFSSDFYEGYFSIYIFPFAMISTTFGYSFSIQNYYPGNNEESTFFTSRFYTAKLIDDNYKEMLESFFTSSFQLNHKIFNEDNSICKKIPKNSWNTKSLRYYSVMEEKINHFRSLCQSENIS